MHIISSLSPQRINFPKEEILCTLTNLQDIYYYVRTEFGNSTSIYGGDIWVAPLKTPLGVIWKGNGLPPDMWEILSTPLLNWLRDAGHVAAFKWCMSREMLKLVYSYFVDDSTIIQVSPTTDFTTPEIVSLALQGLDIFSGASQWTGEQVSGENNK